MSLYQLLNGVSVATFFVLPMLGKHPSEYPRFRDCWTEAKEFTLSDDGMPVITKSPEQQEAPLIYVYTRVGGGNRDDYQDRIDEMRAMEGYQRDYDDDFDSTYATFVFKVPEKWLPDFIRFQTGKPNEISAEYRAEMKRVFPKLAERIDEIFAHLAS